jgi:hypothetical protein
LLGIIELSTRSASCCQFLCLPPQATHSHHRVSLESSEEDILFAAPGLMRFPGISAKLVRICEITGIFHRCNIFLRIIEKFCKPPWRYEGNASGAGLGVSTSTSCLVGRSPLAEGSESDYHARQFGGVL